LPSGRTGETKRGAAHILFSPSLLLVVAGILLWIKFGPRRSRQ
jgi:hypothetical protein